MDYWAKHILNKIDTKVKGVKEKDLRFYRVEEFKRNIVRAADNAKDCEFCREQKPEIEDVVERLDVAINVPGHTRRKYDRLIARLSTHMRKEHSVYTPYHFTYTYSFYGIAAGFILGAVLWILFPLYQWTLLIMSFVYGLITGYVWGNIKDKALRTKKKLM